MLSIIIPTRNRASTLKRTLYSITNQNSSDNYEIIVVDNGSTDNTSELCQSFINMGCNVKYYYDSEPGLLTGRHLGASVAKGDILCYLDDDVIVNPAWISGVKDSFAEQEVQLATGPCLPLYESYPPAWLDLFWDQVSEGKACGWLSLLDFGREKKAIDPNYVWGLNFCIRKSSLLNTGGFHPDNIPQHLQAFQGNGETGVTLKAKEKSYKAIYNPLMMVHHIIPEERLTKEYFEKRAYYQGVCDSFYTLKNKLDQSQVQNSISLQKRIYWFIQKRMNIIKDWTKSDEQKNLLMLLKTKEKEGFEYHQREYRENQKVKLWVDKENYWDYKLPK